MNFEDRTIVCEDCGEEFVFSAEEQEFYESKGFVDPKRCKPCRQRRKEARGGRKFYEAICSNCGVQTTVPFKPSGDRPVYCRECYEAMR